MKQAILITAYKNYNHLDDIINSFDESFSHYIHIDNKSKISSSDLENLRNFKTVKLVSTKYKVNWGGLNHLRAILLVAQAALKDQENEYFHLISGHDFPVKSVKNFKRFFQENRKMNFLENFDVPKPGWADNEGMDRLEYYNFFDILNWKIPSQRKLLLRLLRIQKKLGFKRGISAELPKLYGGSTWWSLNRECLKYVMEFTQSNNDLLERFKFTLCSEEFYVQTVIMNSKYRSCVINDNLRFIDWNYRNGNNPAVLNESDYQSLLSSNAFFARKFEYPESAALVRKIKESLH